jgi:hypothetical protein
MYFFPHNQESLIETKPALIMSAVRGAEICRLEAEVVDGVEGVEGYVEVLKYAAIVERIQYHYADTKR